MSNEGLHNWLGRLCQIGEKRWLNMSEVLEEDQSYSLGGLNDCWLMTTILLFRVEAVAHFH